MLEIKYSSCLNDFIKHFFMKINFDRKTKQEDMTIKIKETGYPPNRILSL